MDKVSVRRMPLPRIAGWICLSGNAVNGGEPDKWRPARGMRAARPFVCAASKRRRHRVGSIMSWLVRSSLAVRKLATLVRCTLDAAFTARLATPADKRATAISQRAPHQSSSPPLPVSEKSMQQSRSATLRERRRDALGLGADWAAFAKPRASECPCHSSWCLLPCSASPRHSAVSICCRPMSPSRAGCDAATCSDNLATIDSTDGAVPRDISRTCVERVNGDSM